MPKKIKKIQAPPNDLKAFFLEMFYRLKAKNPSFFNVLAWVSGIVALLNEIIMWWHTLNIEVNLHPHVQIAIRCITVTAFIMSHLPAKKPTIDPDMPVTE